MTAQNTILSLLVACACLSACGGGGSSSDNLLVNDPTSGSNAQSIDDPALVVDTPMPGEPVSGTATSSDPVELLATSPTARFVVTMENLWGVEDFPQGFPDNAHLSLIGGATHNAAVSFWDLGEVASRGIEDMAEAGLIDVFVFDEVVAAINNGTADSIIEIREYTDPQINGVAGSNTFEIELSANWPLVSLVTMLGPSPDWFVGVSGLSLREDGQWTNSLSVALPLYDGGSKSDITPVMGGPDIIPPNPVGLVAYDTTTGVYLPSDEPQHVARLTFERITMVSQ